MDKFDLSEKLKEELKKRNLWEQEEDEDSEEDNSENEGSSENKDFRDMVSTLLHSRTQVHVFHWQTKSQSSFAEHMALGGFYEGIGD